MFKCILILCIAYSFTNVPFIFKFSFTSYALFSARNRLLLSTTFVTFWSCLHTLTSVTSVSGAAYDQLTEPATLLCASAV